MSFLKISKFKVCFGLDLVIIIVTQEKFAQMSTMYLYYLVSQKASPPGGEPNFASSFHTGRSWINRWDIADPHRAARMSHRRCRSGGIVCRLGAGTGFVLESDRWWEKWIARIPSLNY